MGVYGNGETKQRGKKGAGQTETGYGTDFRGFINVNLTDEQKETYDDWAESSSYWQSFEFFCSDGCALSIKPNTQGGGFIASATQRRVGSPNYGLAVTARASDAAKALGRLLFTLVILSHAEKWEDVQPLADPDRW